MKKTILYIFLGLVTFLYGQTQINWNTQLRNRPNITRVGANATWTDNVTMSGTTNTFSGTTNIFSGATNTFVALSGCQHVNTSQTFATALSAVGTNGCIQVDPGTFPVSVNSTIPIGVTLQIFNTGILSIANAVTLTISGPFLAGNYQTFAYTGTGKAVFGDNSQPLFPTWFPGADIGAQMNNTYAACPVQGCTMSLPGLSSGACYSFTTPILFTTAGKPVNLIGVTLNNTAGNIPGGSCLNYTPLTATTAITLDYINSVGGGYVQQGGMQNITLTNTTSYTNGGPAQGGGSASLAIGIATGTTNGGVGFSYFSNMAIKGFHVGYLHQNSSAGAWGTQFLNVGFSYNDIGFQSTVATEVLDFFGGVFGVNGVAFNMANTTVKFQSVHFDSNFGPAILSGATGANANFTSPHFENLGVGANSCGANSMEQINSSGPAVLINGGDAADDCNTGTNTVYWFNLNGGSINGMLLSTAGRVPSTAVVIPNETATNVNVLLPTAGTVLRTLVTPNTGQQGTVGIITHASNSILQSTQFLTGAGQNSPSCIFTTGGGTSPSCTLDINASDSSGTIIATTGTGSPGSNGSITLTFGVQLGKNRAGCIWNGSLSSAGQWGALATFLNQTVTPGSVIVQWANATGATPAGVALATSTAYAINYTCIGR